MTNIGPGLGALSAGWGTDYDIDGRSRIKTLLDAFCRSRCSCICLSGKLYQTNKIIKENMTWSFQLARWCWWVSVVSRMIVPCLSWGKYWIACVSTPTCGGCCGRWGSRPPCCGPGTRAAGSRCRWRRGCTGTCTPSLCCTGSCSAG